MPEMIILTPQSMGVIFTLIEKNQCGVNFIPGSLNDHSV